LIAEVLIAQFGARQLGAPRDPDYIVVVDASHWRSLDAERRERLMFHELSHLVAREDEFGVVRRNPQTGKPLLKLVPHDVEVFISEVARYGIETVGCEAIAPAIVEGEARKRRRTLKSRKSRAGQVPEGDARLPSAMRATPLVFQRFLRAAINLIDAGKSVTYGNLAGELGRAKQVVWKFVKRHPDVMDYVNEQVEAANVRFLGLVKRRHAMLGMQGSVPSAEFYAKAEGGYFAPRARRRRHAERRAAGLQPEPADSAARLSRARRPAVAAATARRVSPPPPGAPVATRVDSAPAGAPSRHSDDCGEVMIVKIVRKRLMRSPAGSR
jgi:hypothetical protein